MPKIETMGYRPEEWDTKAVLAAEQATGFKRAELIRRCVRRSLGDVVQEILSTHTQAVRTFQEVLKETPMPATNHPTAEHKVTYPNSSSKRGKKVA